MTEAPSITISPEQREHWKQLAALGHRACVTVHIDPATWCLLAALGDVEDVVRELAEHAADGVRNPATPGRAFVQQVFEKDDFVPNLTVDEPSESPARAHTVRTRTERMVEALMDQVVLSPGEDGKVVAKCDILPGCVSEGDTEDHARENIREAIVLCLEVLFPEPKLERAVVLVKRPNPTTGMWLVKDVKDGTQHRVYPFGAPPQDTQSGARGTLRYRTNDDGSGGIWHWEAAAPGEA